MSVTKSWEKHTVRNRTMRVKRLGGQKIEVVTSDLKKELQIKLFRTIRNTGYTRQTEHTKHGNLRCRLLPNDEMSFNELIAKVINLIVRGIERYEKKMASAQSSVPPSRRRKKNYRNRPALATT